MAVNDACFETPTLQNVGELVAPQTELEKLFQPAEIKRSDGSWVQMPLGMIELLPTISGDAASEFVAGNILHPQMRQALAAKIRGMITASCRKDADATRAQVGLALRYYQDTNPYGEALVSLATVQPAMNIGRVPIRDSRVNYYGIAVELPEYTRDNFSACELTIGILSIYDAEGSPVALVDLRRTILTGKPEATIRADPSKLFTLLGENRREPSEVQIRSFLRAYPDYFDQHGPFAHTTNLENVVSMSALPIAGKFGIYQTLAQNNLSAADREGIFAMLKKFTTMAPVAVGALQEHPELLLPLAKLSPDVPQTMLLEKMGRFYYWTAGVAHYYPSEFTHLFETFATQATSQNRREILAEAVAWTFETEGYSQQVAQRALRQRFGEITPLTIDIMHRIQARSRSMIAGLVEFLSSNPDPARMEAGLTIFRDGILAQKSLLSIMFSQESEGLAEQLTLPPLFFEKYRPIVAAIPESIPAREAILELLQMVYIVKQKGITDVANRIHAYWEAEKNKEVVATGAQTGNTALEHARKARGFRRLIEQHIITPPTSRGWRIIDMGSGSGRRLLGPYLDAMRQITPTTPVEMVVGVDLQDLTDQLPEMTQWQTTYIDAAQRAEAQGLQFDEAESDWSASNDSWTIQEQMLNFAAYNTVLRPGGILRIDTPFINMPTHGYAEVARRLHEQFPDVFPGTIEFTYEGSAESKKFLLYYYDVLFKLISDAGFELVNLPKGEKERHDFLQRVIAGEIAYSSEQTEDPFDTPIYMMQGKPRIQVIAKKVREVQDTQNIALLDLLDRFFPGPKPKPIK